MRVKDLPGAAAFRLNRSPGTPVPEVAFERGEHLVERCSGRDVEAVGHPFAHEATDLGAEGHCIDPTRQIGDELVLVVPHEEEFRVRVPRPDVIQPGLQPRPPNKRTDAWMGPFERLDIVPGLGGVGYDVHA